MVQSEQASKVFQAGVIEVRAVDINALFQPLDPAPLAQRALSTHTEAYVVDRFTDPGQVQPVQLRILLPAREAGSCEDVRHAFYAHFSNAASKRKALFRKHFRQGGLMLAKGVALAVILVWLTQVIATFSDSALLARIADGISIVVWVILWRPMDVLIYEWRPLRDALKTYELLAEVDIVCSPLE